MAGLTRTDLTTAQKVSLTAEGVAGQGRYGVVTGLARDYGVSRPTVYSATHAGSEKLTEHFEEDRPNSTVVVAVGPEHLERVVVALRVMSATSIRQIEDILPILYPGVRISFGKVQSILAEAESRAHDFNASVDLSGISACALDEMFSQGNPVLGGIDLDLGYVFALAVRETRSGRDWAEVLGALAEEQGLSVQVVVKDAGAGMAAGVGEVFPDAEQRDDCFHAHYEMGGRLAALERSAYAAIRREEKAEQAIAKMKRFGRGNRRATFRELRAARKACEKAISKYDRLHVSVKLAREALEFVDLETGQLREPQQMQKQLEEAAAQMTGHKNRGGRNMGTYLRNRAPGLSLFMHSLSQHLRELFPRFGEEAVLLACVVRRLIDDLKRRRRPWAERNDKQHLLAAYAQLRNCLNTDDAQALLDSVDECLRRRHRASSAIEGLNCVLRPHLYVHRGVTQGFLELFRAYYNLRIRRWGRFKGTSAHGLLTGSNSGDWLSWLGYPPVNEHKPTIVH